MGGGEGCTSSACYPARCCHHVTVVVGIRGEVSLKYIYIRGGEVHTSSVIFVGGAGGRHHVTMVVVGIRGGVSRNIYMWGGVLTSSVVVVDYDGVG